MKLKQSSTLPINIQKISKRELKKEKIQQGEKALERLASLIDKPFRSPTDHINQLKEEEKDKNRNKNEIKRIVLESGNIRKFFNRSPKTSRNINANKFPQPGSFASTAQFKSTIDKNSPLFEKDQNFVYQSPRNKNSTIKLKAINTVQKEPFALEGFCRSSEGKRTALFLQRTKTHEVEKPKVYNKVQNQAEHLDRIKRAKSRVTTVYKKKGLFKSLTNRSPLQDKLSEIKAIDTGFKVNHIQRAMKKMQQQENLSMAQRINEQADNDNFERICTEMKHIRVDYGARRDQPKQEDAKARRRKLKNLYKPREVPEELLERPIDMFLGVRPDIVCVNKNTEKWIDKRNPKNNRAATKKTIQFAKDLFLSWDDDGSGILEEEEIVHPLLSLGLASDSAFARQLISTLDPKANKPGHDEYELTLKDFVKIFSIDKFTQKMTNMVKKESMDTLMEEFKDKVKNGDIKIKYKPKPRLNEGIPSSRPSRRCSNWSNWSDITKFTQR
ncbi:unnamed protein product [Moneuplotes crassus]|uniref:EF-hand domain-containing protein n=1 Tax=Euplotes crassus TaxID=5936 RepID=A0AAD1UB10_EUPCR|nr:unnamed protein product [Moneuplotes crassus]